MAKISKWLNIYKHLDDELKLLTSTGHYTLLYSTFMSVFEAVGSVTYKENLKIIAGKIIDHIWDHNFEYSDLSVVPPLELSLSNSTIKQNERKISTSSSQCMKKFDYSLISDFSYAKGPGTFSRSTKILKESKSPGPADYFVNMNQVKDRPPQVITPTTRKEFKRNNSTPGPGSYNPLHAFKAR